MKSRKRIYDHLSNKELEVWDNAMSCDCGEKDCSNNHKLCNICLHTVLFGAYEQMQPTSNFSWNIDHKIPKSKFWYFQKTAFIRGFSNVDDLKNLQIVHVSCNLEKGDSFNER